MGEGRGEARETEGVWRAAAAKHAAMCGRQESGASGPQRPSDSLACSFGEGVEGLFAHRRAFNAMSVPCVVDRPVAEVPRGRRSHTGTRASSFEV